MVAIGPIVAVIAALVGAVLLTGIVMFIIVPIFKGIGFLLAHLGQFIGGMFRDIFRFIGAVPAAIVFATLSVLNVIIGRWSASAHFGANVQRELKTMASCVYRVGIGHPLRLIGLGSMLEGIEQRVPAAVAESPGRERPSRRAGQFDGYTIVGSLPGGGSGGRLYVAEPSPAKRERIARQMGDCPDRVVIKSFAIADGSSLPQIVRESRALEGARQIGLILEHELTDDRFFYVMPYVPGENLGVLARQCHAASGEQGLGDRHLHEMLGYMSDVVATLNHYHRGGLWHKDIKPENIVVHAGQAHVVDLGLVTSLRSAMTLTTHGTEYFRDPEMVRMALRGVKVHEVDGARFDIYGAAAVMYFIFEGTFPSHGGLSTVTRRCPDAVKWIVRRGMTDYNQRYASAELMLRDLEAVRRHPNIWAMKPIELPSMKAAGAADQQAEPQPQPQFASFGSMPGAAAASAAVGAVGAGGDYGRPGVQVANWWTGRIGNVTPRTASMAGIAGLHEAKDEIRKAAHTIRSEVRRAWQDMRGDQAAGTAGPVVTPGPEAVRINFGDGPRHSAFEQISRARARAQERRRTARARRHQYQHPAERINGGMVVAAIAVLGVIGLASMITWGGARRMRTATATIESGMDNALTYGSRSISISPTHGVVVNIPGAPEAPAAEARDAALAASVASLPDHYLIINDHPDLRSAEVRDRVAQIAQVLTTLGFEPLEDSAQEATLDARIRTEVSRVGPVNIEKNEVLDAEVAVGSLLGSDDELADIGCVVWLSRGSSDRILTWVLTPQCATSEIDDRILARLSSIH
ncbi:MAG: hypothetical protein IT430_13535 [Phycisphaerales bacterium]|nr:hypothetical protein [Phycisphaerales bacterium]